MSAAEQLVESATERYTLLRPHLDERQRRLLPGRGAQYTSSEFQKWCAGNRVTQSMGEVGVCWDNAVAENSSSHLKTEMYHHHTFDSRLAAARTAVMDYIEGWYNRRRPNRRASGIPPATALANHHTRPNEPVAA